MTVESLKTFETVKKVAAEHYAGQEKEMKSGRPFCWGMAFCPAEIPRSMGMEVILAEPYGMTCVAGGFEKEFNAATDNYGFGCDMCSYGRNYVGSYLLNKGPLDEMRKPTYMIGIKLACNDHIAWLETLSMISGSPIFVMDIPGINGDIEQRHIDYVVEQLAELTKFIEKTTGIKCDGGKLAQTVIYKHEALEYWTQILDRCKNVPSPLAFRNLLTFMHPAVHMKGKKEAVDLYKAALDEIDDRIKRGVTTTAGEKIRLYWDNVPPWYHMDLVKYLGMQQAEVVISFYFQLMAERYPISPLLSEKGKKLLQWEEPHNLEESFREIAKSLIIYQTYENVTAKLDFYEKMVKEWHCDGAVFHANMGCKGLSNGRREVVKYLKEKVGIPVFEFQGNMADSRFYNHEETMKDLSEFIEGLIKAKGK